MNYFSSNWYEQGFIEKVNWRLVMLTKIKTMPQACAIYIRDRLNAKYPITHRLLPTLSEKAWLTAITDALMGENYDGLGDILQRLDLGITSKATGIKSFIDLNAAAFPFIFDALNRLGCITGETLYIYDNIVGWKSLKGARFKAWIMRPSSSGYIELAIVRSDTTLASRFSINLWQQKKGFIESSAVAAPLKKISKDIPVFDLAPYDSQIGSIDAVYTWVNGEDENWQMQLSRFRDLKTIDPDRFHQSDELKYSLRSIFTYASWLRKIFIFSNCAPPNWFVPSDRVRWIMHDEVVPEKYLPLFNSHSIETYLHKIPDLAEQYIYFNDDVFLSGFVKPSDFFTPYGQSLSRLEPYGIVPYLEQKITESSAEEWQCAAVSGATLISNKFGRFPTQLHQHTPHAFIKSTFEDLTAAFPTELEITRKARFREPTDISFASFLYHHYALNSGKAVRTYDMGMIVRATNYRRFLSQKTYLKKNFFCINDGGGSAKNLGFTKFKKQFLSDFYQFKSPAEI